MSSNPPGGSGGAPEGQTRGIAHDLNNVLLAMRMLAEQMRHDAAGNTTVLTKVEQIEEQVRRGMDVAGRLTELAGASAAPTGGFEPGSVIEEVALLARESFPQRVEVRHRVAPGLPMVRGEASRLFEVLMNLALNARDAIPGGGTISMVADTAEVRAPFDAVPDGVKSGPHVVITVTDNGTGMTPEVHSRLFTPFFTTRTERKGAGLGLSKSLGIVKSLGGGISIRSQAGVGTESRVFLPAVTDGRKETAGATSSAQLRGNGELVLLVDDDPSVLAICKSALEQGGYRAVASEDGRSALALFAKRHADVSIVVTDMCMPGIDGSQVLVSVRRTNPSVKVVVCSGFLDDAERERLTKLGADGFLAKPYRASDLLRAMRDALAVPGKA